MTCPDQQTLASLLVGQLPSAQVELLARHLESCFDCGQQADQLGIDDPLAAPLRSSISPGSDPDEPRINNLINNLCLLRPTGRGAELADSPLNTLWDVRGSLISTNRVGFLGRIGSYWVQNQIGSGGMGEVYLARQERPNRSVAIKIIRARPGSDTNLFARFRAEANTAARLRHPNIVQIYEAGESAEAAFIAMELVEGGSLAARLAEAVLAPREAAKLLSQLAKAVHFAHVNGVVHRDLKPSNVLLDRDGTPKLSDFGLAKLLDDDDGNQTKTGIVLGTPAYMAPEQAADGKAVGPAADVYGLGAILYECLTGRPPFKGATALDTLGRIRTHEPILPGRLQPGIPRDIQTICLKCLEKDPNRRYATAGILAEDLDRFLNGQPIVARPVGLLTRGWKWARRRPTIAALLLTSGTLSFGLVLLTLIYTARLRTEVDRANANAAETRRQQDRAASNYRSARGALSQMLRRLDDPRVAVVPRPSDLRQYQLEDALAFYESVLHEHDDPNPEIQLDTALAASEAGEIQFWLAREGPARETFLRAVELFERLPNEFRTRLECRMGLIHCFNHLAVLDKDHPKKIAEYLAKAQIEAEELIGSDPADPIRQNALARVEHNVAVHLHESGQTNQADEHYRRAIEIRGRLVAAQPENQEFQADLSEDLLNLGHVYLCMNLFDKATDAFLRAENLLRPLAEAHPFNTHYALSLAALYINWGNLLIKSDLAGALAKYNKAIELADDAAVREPWYLLARNRALQAHGARSIARYEAKQIVDALADWDRVVDLADESTRSGHRANRAVVTLKAGLSYQALAEAYALIGDPRISDQNRYNLACILALSCKPMTNTLCLGSLADVAAEEDHKTTAMRLLRRLQDSGYFRQPGHEKLLAEDPDFAFLRHRADFQSLIDNAAKP